MMPLISRTPQSVFREFAQNTSLLGIQHFLRNKSFVWLIAYLFCIAMSIFQSWNVTLSFFRQHSYQTVTLTSKKLLPFPSVTVCSNTVLRDGFDYSLITDFNVSAYYTMRDNCTNSNLSNDELQRIIFKNERAVLAYVRKMSDERRMTLGVNLSQYVSSCFYEQKFCNFSDPRDIHVFSHPYYANCFTFNPALEENSAKMADTHAMLRLEIQLQPGGFWLVPFDKPTVSIYVHAPGTAPVMGLTQTQYFHAGQSAIMDLVLTEMVAIKKRTLSFPSCVDANDLKYRKRNRFYTPQAPYTYSLEACMMSCEQDHVGEQCKTVNPVFPKQSEDYERGKSPQFSFMCKINASLNMEECNCPRPCTRMNYRIVQQNVAHNNPCQDEQTGDPGSNRVKEKRRKEAAGLRNQVSVFISFQSNIYEKTEEKLSCNLSEYLGILGGNLSLWTGLCIISLLEVVELVVKVGVAAARAPKKIPYHNRVFVIAKKEELF